MKDGLEEFLKRIEAKPTNETLIDRFMTLVLEVEGVDRILYLKKLVGLLLNSNPYVALKAAYVELQEARKEKLSHEYEVGALKDVESCFLKLGRTDNAALVREEINKYQSTGNRPAEPAAKSLPPKKSFPAAEPAPTEFGEDDSNGSPREGTMKRAAAPESEDELDAFDDARGSDPLRDEPLPSLTLLEGDTASNRPQGMHYNPEDIDDGVGIFLAPAKGGTAPGSSKDRPSLKTALHQGTNAGRVDPSDSMNPFQPGFANPPSPNASSASAPNASSASAPNVTIASPSAAVPPSPAFPPNATNANNVSPANATNANRPAPNSQMNPNTSSRLDSFMASAMSIIRGSNNNTNVGPAPAGTSSGRAPASGTNANRPAPNAIPSNANPPNATPSNANATNANRAPAEATNATRANLGRAPEPEKGQFDPIQVTARNLTGVGTAANRMMQVPEEPIAPPAVEENADEENPDDIFSMKFEYTKRSKLPELLDENEAAAEKPAADLGRFSAASLNDSEDDDNDILPVVPPPASNYFADAKSDEPTNPRGRSMREDGEGTAIISVESLQESMKQMASVAKSVAPEYEFRTANDDRDIPDFPLSQLAADVEDEDESKLYFAPDDDPPEAEEPPPELSNFRGSPPPPRDSMGMGEVTSFLDLGAILPDPASAPIPPPAAPVVHSAIAPTLTPRAPAPPVEQPLQPLTSDDDWKLFQERLKMLSGWEIGPSHATEFVRRLLRVNRETNEVQETLVLLSSFIERKADAKLKKKICRWLFEQLPSDSLHDLMESMTLSEESLRFYAEHLRNLYEDAQYRRILRVVRDVTREGLAIAWYKHGYKYLPDVWKKLGMEGWSWSESEGAQPFCDSILRRENPSLALLLA